SGQLALTTGASPLAGLSASSAVVSRSGATKPPSRPVSGIDADDADDADGCCPRYSGVGGRAGLVMRITRAPSCPSRLLLPCMPRPRRKVAARRNRFASGGGPVGQAFDLTVRSSAVSASLLRRVEAVPFHSM